MADGLDPGCPGCWHPPAAPALGHSAPARSQAPPSCAHAGGCLPAGPAQAPPGAHCVVGGHPGSSAPGWAPAHLPAGTGSGGGGAGELTGAQAAPPRRRDTQGTDPLVALVLRYLLHLLIHLLNVLPAPLLPLLGAGRTQRQGHQESASAQRNNHSRPETLCRQACSPSRLRAGIWAFGSRHIPGQRLATKGAQSTSAVCANGGIYWAPAFLLGSGTGVCMRQRGPTETPGRESLVGSPLSSGFNAGGIEGTVRCGYNRPDRS